MAMSQSERERLGLELMAEATKYAEENNCSLGAALSEVTKREPHLWNVYSQAVVGRRVKAKDSGRIILMGEVEAFAKENGCSLSVALTEVTKRRPELWRAYSEQVMGLKQENPREDQK
jgi:hypothetical protein